MKFGERTKAEGLQRGKSLLRSTGLSQILERIEEGMKDEREGVQKKPR